MWRKGRKDREHAWGDTLWNCEHAWGDSLRIRVHGWGDGKEGDCWGKRDSLLLEIGKSDLFDGEIREKRVPLPLLMCVSVGHGWREDKWGELSRFLLFMCMCIYFLIMISFYNAMPCYNFSIVCIYIYTNWCQIYIVFANYINTCSYSYKLHTCILELYI